MKKVNFILFIALITVFLYSCSNSSQEFNIDSQLEEENMKQGIIKFEKKDYSGCIVDCNKVLEVNPKSYAAYMFRGSALMALKDYSGTIRDFNKAIELDSNEAFGYGERGILKMILNERRGAKSDIDKAIRLDPNYAPPYISRGLFLIENDYTSALAAFDKAIELDPNAASAYIGRGQTRINILISIVRETKANEISELLDSACKDFSKAGELGKEDAYSLIEKYCNKDPSFFVKLSQKFHK
jgi:tetratricopeptide (TPR) repeat protein